MQRSGIENPSDDSGVHELGGDPIHGNVATSGDELRQEREGPANDHLAAEHEALLAKATRLERELDRYREHAQRTSKLFLSVTNYVEWVRESARRDAEIALRKARARVEKLESAAIDLEQTETELARARDELAHLQALTEVTRERLSTFLNTGLQILDSDVVAAQDASPDPALDDLQDTLQERLTSTSLPASPPPTEVEGPAA